MCITVRRRLRKFVHTARGLVRLRAMLEAVGKKIKVFFVLVLIAGTALFLGQACGPMSAISEEELASLGFSYLTEAEKTGCKPSASRSESGFQTLEDLASYLDEQPRPVQIHCVIANLPRPLKMQAGISAASAQPAAGEANPRVFLKVGSLILSVVPDGIAKNTLEIGAIKTASQATHAEFTFPISDAQIRANLGLDEIRNGRGTTCGFCHRNEKVETAENLNGAFRADILRFALSERRPVSAVKQLADACAAANDQSDRCLLIRALMNGSTPVEMEF